MARIRIDTLLVERGIANSTAHAQALVMSGVVLADEKRVEKPSESFAANIAIRIKGDGPESKYASRAGLKLEAALKEFSVDPHGLICLDIGSSTGGFTDCLLQHGAEKVVAIDSGTNQMIWRLRTDPRVEVREQTNARELKPEDFTTKFDLAVMDVSFISVKKIIPAIISLLKPTGAMVILIKPQFEVAKSDVGDGGIVRDPDKHQQVISDIDLFAENAGLRNCGIIGSPILGAEGNKEFLALYAKR